LQKYNDRCDILEQQNKELLTENRQLRDENRQLCKENTQIKKTVSTLAARNINAKSNKPKNTTLKKNNSKHPRKSRNRSTHIDDTITVDQKECNVCGTKLSNPTDSYTRIVEDVIPTKAITTYTIIRRYCKNCKKQISGNIHTALPNE